MQALALRSGSLLMAAATTVLGQHSTASWGSLPRNQVGFLSPEMIK